MMKRIATRSPLEVEEFDTSSGKGMVEIEAVFEVDPRSRSVSPAEVEAAEAPSLPLSSQLSGRWASISIASSTTVCADNGDDDGGLAVVDSSSSRIVKTSSKDSWAAGANEVLDTPDEAAGSAVRVVR